MTRTSTDLGPTDLHRDVDGTRPPAPLVVSLALTGLVAWVATCSVLDLPTSVIMLGVLAGAGAAAWWTTASGSLVVAALAFLVADGFVLGSLGELTWDPVALVWAVALGVVCFLVTELRRGVTVLSGR